MPRPIGFIGASICTVLLLTTSSSVLAQEATTQPNAPGAGAPPRRPAANPQRPSRPNAGAAGRGANVPVPDDIQLVRDVIYATVPDKDGHTLDLQMDCAFLKQSDGEPMPVVMYIHGGGWRGGERAHGLPFALAFARGGYFACTVSYRLSDQATFPAQIHDVKAAVRFLRANAGKLAIDPHRIGVWGHSAGGHLSALLGVSEGVQSLEGEVGDNAGSSAVQAVVDVSGPTDLLLIAPDGGGGPMVSGLLGGPVSEKQELAKAASPVTHVDATDAPFLIIQGGQDRLVPNEQAEIMRDALKLAGVECEYLYLAEAGHAVMDRSAFEATAKFFDRHLGGDSVAALDQIARRLPTITRDAGGARAPQDQRPQPSTRPD
jgi:acetyl esterase/lipase